MRSKFPQFIHSYVNIIVNVVLKSNRLTVLCKNVSIFASNKQDFHAIFLNGSRAIGLQAFKFFLTNFSYPSTEASHQKWFSGKVVVKKP